MAGVVNDYLIYPILDLIQQEIKKASNSGAGTEFVPIFEETPSVVLYREHPLETNRVTVTGAELIYLSGFVVYVYLHWSSPSSLEEPGYRLTQVKATFIDPNGSSLFTRVIGLDYDERGLVTGTLVSQIE